MGFPAYGDEGVVLLTRSDKVFRLEKQGKKFLFRPLTDNLLESAEFQRQSGHTRTPVGETQVGTSRNKPVVRTLEGERWSGNFRLPKLKEGETYAYAQRDASGNFYIFLDQSGKFAFGLADGSFFASPEETSAEIPEDIGSYAANPYGPGMFAMSGDGAHLALMWPPKKEPGGFQTIQWDSKKLFGDNLAKIVVGDVGGEVGLFVLTESGKVGRVSIETGDPKELTFEPITAPDSQPPTVHFKLISTFDSRAAARIQNARLMVPPSRAFALVPYNGGPARSNTPDPSTPAKSFGGVNIDDTDRPFTRAIARNLTDQVNAALAGKRQRTLIGRKEEIQRLIEVLIRSSGNHPILLGGVGTGKTTMPEILAHALLSGDYPSAAVFKEVLDGAIVVETTPGLIEGAGDLAKFFLGMRNMEDKTGKRIITFINRMQDMSPGQLAALKSVLSRDTKRLVVGMMLPGAWDKIVQKDEEILKVFEPIRLTDFTDEEVRRILNETVKLELLRRYEGSITAEPIEIALRRATQIYPELGRPEGPRRLLEDMMIRAAARKVPLDVSVAREVVKERLKLPFDPYNREEFDAALEKMRRELKTEVLEQDRLIDWLVNSYRDILDPEAQRRHRSILLLGPTGSGKTHTMQAAFRKFFGSEDRILEIDCTKYVEKEALTTLLGSWPGYVGSDKLGQLPRFLAGRGKHLNGIIFNEWEKAHPELANAIMDMLATGKITDSHGNDFYLGTSIIGFTSNKGDEVFFPRGASLTRAEQERRASAATSDEVKQRFLEPDGRNRYDTSRQHNPANMQRIDAAMYMLPPSEPGAVRLLREITLAKIEKEKRVRIEVDPALLQYLVTRRYVPENGAREIQRNLTDLVNEAYAYYAKVLQHAADTLPEGERPVLRLHWEAPVDGKPGRIYATLSSSPAAVQDIVSPFIADETVPLEDPAVRDHIASLRPRLGAQVFGQERAIEAAARAVINQRYFDPDPSRPSVLGFFGPTGTGKSELAEVLAEIEFGTRKRCKTFEMGGLKEMGDVDNLFGTARGRSGSETAAPFEEWVARYEKEGAVIHFEEMGNVGPGRPDVRDAVFRILYSILEGKWTSALGKTYDTRKFMVVFSSNEGQELFAGAPSDDLRAAEYERARKQAFMHALLTKAGWPEPLLGRMQGNLILFKPLLKLDRREIAKKLVGRVVTRLNKRYPVILGVGDEFYDALGDLFFTHERGARNLKDFSEKEFETLLADTMVPLYAEMGRDARAALQRSTLKFRFADSYAGKTFFVGPQPDPRVVTLHLEIVENETGRVFAANELDVTESVAERSLPSRKSLLRTAYHEAGHVVANDPSKTGSRMEHVTIIGMGRYGGYARWKQLADRGAMTRATALAKLAMFFGGRVAEELAGFDPDSGWTQDLEMARELAAECVARYGLTDKALRLPLKDKKVDLSSPMVADEIARLLEEAIAASRERLTKHWAVVKLLTGRLFKEQALEAEAIEAILDRAKEPAFLGTTRPKAGKKRCSEALVDAGLEAGLGI